MKIYQLHKYSGEYEDFSDDIIGSYLKPERAKEELTKAEKEEMELRRQGRKCQYCPICDYGASFDLDVEDVECENKDAEFDSQYGWLCKNYSPHWDDATFEIEEVEVEE